MNPKRINKQKGKGATYKRKLMDLYKVSGRIIYMPFPSNNEETPLMKMYKIGIIKTIANEVDDAWIKMLNNRRDIKSEYGKYNPKHNDINPILTRTEQDITGGPMED